jgi:predicted DNA-binding ribbon-helix-helix protein
MLSRRPPAQHWSRSRRRGTVEKTQIGKKSLSRKRSFSIGQRRTSTGLEDAFWHSLKVIAAHEGVSVSRLIAQIDAQRQHSNLSSAIRLYVLDHYRTLVESQADPPSGFRGS